MRDGRSERSRLPNIFPHLGPATRYVLFADFSGALDEPAPADWKGEYETLISHGLGGVAYRVVRERSLEVGRDIADQLEQSYVGDMFATMTMVARSAAGLRALEAAKIPFVVTKGPGTALASPSMSDRPFIDLDVVVPPDHFTLARGVLGGSGYAEKKSTMQPWDIFNRFCREAVNLRTADGGSIDLHHRVSPWYWSTGLTFDLLHASSSVAEAFGLKLPLISAEHNLLVTALHVVSDKSRPGQTYRAWRDLLVLAGACPVERVVAAATATGLAPWLAWVLGCLPAEVQPDELIDRLNDVKEPFKGGARLRALLPPRLGSDQLIGQIFRLPVPQAALFAAGMAIPSRGYLLARYPVARHRYVTWWRASLENITKGEWKASRS